MVTVTLGISKYIQLKTDHIILPDENHNQNSEHTVQIDQDVKRLENNRESLAANILLHLQNDTQVNQID